MKKLIVVSDWAKDTLACQEFKSAVEGHLNSAGSPNIDFVESEPSTIHTAFLLNQLVQTEEYLGKPLNTVFFVNTDLRENKKTKAEPLIIKLKSGIVVIGPNSQNSFSLIKDKIEVVFIYDEIVDSQFRSRDLYSKVCSFFMENREDELFLEEAHLNLIPYLEKNKYYIGHIDNYGNIKTTITHEELKGRYEYDDNVEINIGGVKKIARYVPGLFKGEVGELIIYPGSSGNKNNPFIEISAWMTPENPKTGIYYFPKAKPGNEVIIK